MINVQFSLSRVLILLDLIFVLFCVCFKGPGWDYQTELPDWARVDWIDVDSNE